MIPESDNHLMEEVRDGKVEKLAILFERHHVMLYNFFLRFTGNRSASERLNAICVKLGVLPEEQPGFELRTRFYSMLEAYKEGMIPEEPKRSFLKNFSDRVGRFMPRKPLHQFAFSLALLIAGIALGYFFLTSKQIENAKVTALRQEVQNMQEMMAVFLLDQPSPSERLKGVSWSSKLEQPEEKTLQALLRTLDTDPNINVRLAAVDALYLFYRHPLVKEGLVQSRSHQTSPLVQIALIDLLVEIRERRAADALKQLIQDEKLHPEVKQRAKTRLAQLG